MSELERMKFHAKRNFFKEVLDLKTGKTTKITNYIGELEQSKGEKDVKPNNHR